MKLFGGGSLRTRLIVRLVVFQTLAICIVAATGVYVLLLRYGIDGAVVNMRDPEVVIDAVRRLPDGRLAVERTEQIEALRRGSPGFWYVVVDGTGQRVEEGDVPATLRSVADDIAAFGTSNIAAVDDAAGHAAALRVNTGAAGRVHVLTGGGRLQPIWVAALETTSRAMIPIVTTLALVAVLAIAWMIRREFRGVDKAARLAATIDAGKRGTRLPEEGLPSEIVPLVKAVNDALGRLDEGYARQRRFLADAAHELKTPIAILHTRIETSPPGPERDRRLLLDIARLGNLAEQLLDTQRLDHSPATFAEIDLVALARGVAADLAPLAIAAGYEFGFDSDLPRLAVKGDRPALERVVVNLVQNAVAHGGGTGAIVVRIDADGVLEVADQGAGIAAEERERIFEPFHRTRPSDRGAGLGLTIVSDIVGRHGGRIAVEDAEPAGTVFRVHLPAGPAGPAEHRDAEAGQRRGGAGERRPPG